MLVVHACGPPQPPLAVDDVCFVLVARPHRRSLLTMCLSLLGGIAFLLSSQGYHLLGRGREGSGWEQCCLHYFPLCFDWRAERLVPKASHREVWIQDALSMTVDELEEAETNQDIKKFVQGGDSTSWTLGAKGGAAAVGIKFQSGIWRFANNLSRRIFGISLRRGFFLLYAKLERPSSRAMCA